MFVLAKLCVAVGLAAGTMVPAAFGQATDVEAATAEVTQLIDADRPADAEAAARRWLDRVEATHGPDALETVRIIDLYALAARTSLTPMRAELVALARRAVRVKEATFGRDHVEVADSLSRLAGILRKSGDQASAETTIRRAIAIRESASGGSGAALADNFRQLALVQQSTARLDDAIASASRAIEALGDPASAPKLASWIYVLQEDLLTAKGRLAEARAAAERNVAFVERLLPDALSEVVSAYFALADIESSQSEFAAARRDYERAAAIASRDLRPDGPDVVPILKDLSLVQEQLGDFAGARATIDRSIALSEKLHGPSAEATLSARMRLGYLLTSESRFDEAAAIYDEIIARCPKGDPSHAIEYGVQLSLGGLEMDRGHLARSRRALNRSLELAIARYGPDSKEVGEVEMAFGALECRTGEMSGAKSRFEKGIATMDSGYGRESIGGAYARYSAGTSFYMASDYASAIPLLKEAVRILEKVEGPEHVDLAGLLDALALAYFKSGDPARARSIERRAVGIVEHGLGGNHPSLSDLLENLAEFEMRVDAATPALAHVTRAISIQESIGGPTARLRKIVAVLRFLGGRPREALNEALRAEDESRELFQAATSDLSDRESLYLKGRQDPPLDVAVTVIAGTPALERGDAARRVWDAVVRSRALVLDAAASRHRAIGRNAPATVRLLDQRLARARQRAANLTTTAGAGPESREALREAEGIERELAEASRAAQADEERLKVGLDAVAAALPDGTALVSYVRYQRVVPTPGGSGKPIYRVEPSYLAFVSGRGPEGARAIALGDAATIDAAEAAWRRAVETAPPSIPGGPAHDADASYRAAAERLRALAWDPVARAFPSATATVLIVPDGRLSLVSFVSLPVGDHYLLEDGPTIHYLSSERDVLRAADAARSGRGVLAIGGPDFDSAPRGPEPASVSTAEVYRAPVASCEGVDEISFDPLPGAALEAEEVAAQWGAARADEPVVVWTGAQADETDIKRNASRYSIIHLASHGFFTPERCGGDSSRGEAAPETPLDPLLSSGVALAGANRRHAAPFDEDRDDGMLTAEEASSIDLSNAEWVVLSTCGSGLGEIAGGEGVVGLRRAFEVAGAGTLVMSLWNVRDVETRRFMHELYAARLAGRSTADAMRKAAREVLAERRRTGRATHPCDWGAFVAAGSWR